MTEESDKISQKGKHSRKGKAKPQTKVIIRHLPPSMTELEFLKQIDPVPQHDNYYYVPADWSLGFDATCRAYITFSRQEDVFLFRDRFDGYVFVDSKGAEYPAVVEFAPFQGLPKNRCRKSDNKANSIETEPHYISFLEKLANIENENTKSDLILEFSLEPKYEKKVTSTPLLQYLADRKQSRRDERKKRSDERRRQRDDDTKKQKIAIAKKIPPVIPEESNSTEKEAAGKDKSKTDDNKTKKQKSRREQRRNEKREQYIREKQAFKEKGEKTVEKSKNAEGETDTNREDGNKKYSERREKLMISKESKPNTVQTEIKSSAEATFSNVKTTDETFLDNAVLKARDSSCSAHGSEKNGEKSGRRIRNKDRPSLQIYQPGKLRNIKNADDDEPKDPKLKFSLNTEFETLKNDDKDKVGKKVSRYSDKRTSRNKESSDNLSEIECSAVHLPTAYKVDQNVENTN